MRTGNKAKPRPLVWNEKCPSKCGPQWPSLRQLTPHKPSEAEARGTGKSLRQAGPDRAELATLTESYYTRATLH